MIKIKKGNVELKGSLAELLSETTLLHQAMHEMMTEKGGFAEEEAKALLQESVDMAFMNELELVKKLLDKMTKAGEEDNDK